MNIGSYLKKVFYILARSTWRCLSIYNCVSGKGSKIHSNGMVANTKNNKSRVVIGQNTYIAGYLEVCRNCGNISIGNSTFIGEGSRIYSAKSVLIGDRVQIAHNCSIFDNNIHSLDPDERAFEFSHNMKNGWSRLFDLKERDVVINDDVWLGAGVIVLKGVTIGKGAVIGAGSVVTTDIPDYSIAVGNPARVVKRIDVALLKS